MLGTLKWYLNNDFPGGQISEHIYTLPFPLARVPSRARETKARPGCVVSFRQQNHFVWFCACCPFCLATSGWWGLRQTRMGRMCHWADPKSSFRGTIPSTVSNLPSTNLLQDIQEFGLWSPLGPWQGLREGEPFLQPTWCHSSSLTQIENWLFSGFRGTLSRWGWETFELSSHSHSEDTEPERLQFLAGPALNWSMGCVTTQKPLLSLFFFFLLLVFSLLSREGWKEPCTWERASQAWVVPSLKISCSGTRVVCQQMEMLKEQQLKQSWWIWADFLSLLVSF